MTLSKRAALWIAVCFPLLILPISAVSESDRGQTAGISPMEEHSGTRSIETSVGTLRLSTTSGDLVGLVWKHPGLEIIRESRLGENFRILIPKRGYEADYFYSREQKVSQIEVAPDGVVCVYDSLRNDKETLPIHVRYRIQAVGRQVQFSIQVKNPTERKLAEVMYGIIGGQKGIGDRLDTQAMIPGPTQNMGETIFSRFQGGGYGGDNLGIRYDAMAFSYPRDMSMGWVDVYNPKADIGYYYGNQDPDTRLRLLELEMRPFTKSATVGDNWPTPAEADGRPIGITVGWVDMPYLSKGTYTAGPVALQAHSGDWHTASGIYRAWFDQHFKVDRPPSWLRQENAWQSITLSNSEDVVAHRFDELPKLAADAKKYGITTFEILGWDSGGIDRGYPQYTPNPRLGTAQEFRQALAEIRGMGVHPLIFSNIQFADTATSLFQDKLKQYVVDGRWAPDWGLTGWGEGTISARAGFTRSNMTFVSPAYPAFREYLVNQYLQLIRDGADGFQFDKSGNLAHMDFNPALPVSPDKSLVMGVLQTLQELTQKGRAIDPNLAIAAENFFDRALPYIDVSYMRMGQIDMPSTAFRYTFPEWTATIFGESPGDFNPMNNGMRYGLVWDLAPRHYNDSVNELLTQPLARYVSELIRIRKEYSHLLFFGRFNDTRGATIHGDADIRYSVFKPLRAGVSGEACVVVNFGDAPETAYVSLDSMSGEVQIATPYHPDYAGRLPLDLTIPAHQVAVVVKR